MNWDSLTLPARKHHNVLVCPYHMKGPWNPALVNMLLLTSVKSSAPQLSSPTDGMTSTHTGSLFHIQCQHSGGPQQLSSTSPYLPFEHSGALFSIPLKSPHHALFLAGACPSRVLRWNPQDHDVGLFPGMNCSQKQN